MGDRGRTERDGNESNTGMITAGYRRNIYLDGEKDVVEIELRVNIPANASEAEVDAAVRSAQRALDAMRASVDTRVRDVAKPALPPGWPQREPANTTSVPAENSTQKQTVAVEEAAPVQKAEQPTPAPSKPASRQAEPLPTPVSSRPLPRRVEQQPEETPVPARTPAASAPQQNEQPAASMPTPNQRIQAPSVNERAPAYEQEPEEPESEPEAPPSAPIVRPQTPTATRWSYGGRRAQDQEAEPEQETKKSTTPPAAELQEAVANVVSMPRRPTPPAVRPAAPQGANPRTELPATPQQIQSIKDMAQDELRMSESQIEAKIREMTGRTLSMMSRNQAFQVIIELRREVNQRNSGEDMTELERARSVIAPVGPFKGKTLGEIEEEKPGAVNYFITARGVSPDVQEAARIIVNNRRGGEPERP